MPHVARLPRPALRSLALAAWATLALAMASVGAGCASGERAGAAPIADDPRWEGARRCLAGAALVDRVEGGVAVVVACGDPAAVVQGDVFEALSIWRDTNGCFQLKADSFVTEGPFLRRKWERCLPGSALEFALFPGGHVIPEGWAEMALDWFEGL